MKGRNKVITKCELKAAFDIELDTLIFIVADTPSESSYKVLERGLVLAYNNDDVLQSIMITSFSSWNNTLDRLTSHITELVDGPPFYVIEEMLRVTMSRRRRLH
jgi:hypothetical protein